MRQKNCEKLASHPKRQELRENPVQLCCAIARLHRSTMREQGFFEGVMTQPGARLVMSFLAVHGELTQRELVELTHLRAPSISAILKKMEEAALVERRSNPEDLREIRVTLTEAGKSLDRQILSHLTESDARAIEGLDEEELALLMRLLARIRDNLLREQSEPMGGDR